MYTSNEHAIGFASYFWIEAMKAVLEMRDKEVSNEELYDEWITLKSKE